MSNRKASNWFNQINLWYMSRNDFCIFGMLRKLP